MSKPHIKRSSSDSTLWKLSCSLQCKKKQTGDTTCFGVELRISRLSLISSGVCVWMWTRLQIFNHPKLGWEQHMLDLEFLKSPRVWGSTCTDKGICSYQTLWKNAKPQRINSFFLYITGGTYLSFRNLHYIRNLIQGDLHGYPVYQWIVFDEIYVKNFTNEVMSHPAIKPTAFHFQLQLQATLTKFQPSML